MLMLMLMSMLLMLNHWNLLTADSAGSDGVIVKAGKEGSTRLAWWKMVIMVVLFFSFNCLDLQLTWFRPALLPTLYYFWDYLLLVWLCQNVSTCLLPCWLCQKLGPIPVSWLILSKIWNTSCFLLTLSKIWNTTCFLADVVKNLEHYLFLGQLKDHLSHHLCLQLVVQGQEEKCHCDQKSFFFFTKRLRNNLFPQNYVVATLRTTPRGGMKLGPCIGRMVVEQVMRKFRDNSVSSLASRHHLWQATTLPTKYKCLASPGFKPWQRLQNTSSCGTGLCQF